MCSHLENKLMEQNFLGGHYVLLNTIMDGHLPGNCQMSLGALVCVCGYVNHIDMLICGWQQP